MFVHTPLLRPSEQKKSHGTVCSPSVPERYWRTVEHNFSAGNEIIFHGFGVWFVMEKSEQYPRAQSIVNGLLIASGQFLYPGRNAFEI
jgi:hypothetical protein